MARRKNFEKADVIASFKWFFRQPESRPALDYLQSVIEEIGPVETCALHAHNERRKFASDLIAIGTEDLGSDGPDTTDDDERRRGPAGKKPEPTKSRRHGPAGR